MDITRNWRLKTNRSQLLATRCPETGAVILPQQTASTNRTPVEVYQFEDADEQPQTSEASFAQAAR